jgi:hypothetical protein
MTPPRPASFDFAAFFAALDSQRRGRGLGWYDVADERPHPDTAGAGARR